MIYQNQQPYSCFNCLCVSIFFIFSFSVFKQLEQWHTNLDIGHACSQSLLKREQMNCKTKRKLVEMIS